MIQIYKVENKDFEHNGDMILNPTYCKITRKLNLNEQEAIFNLELEHPFDKEGRWKYILDNCVTKAPTPAGNQLFRIYKTEKSMFKIVAYARHVFWDLEKIIIKNDTYTEDTFGLKTMLDKALKNTSFKHNVTWEDSFWGECKYMSIKEMLLGDYENNLKSYYNVDFDNFKIVLIEEKTGIGKDNGFRADFGYNLKEITETIDIADVVTRIIATCTRKDEVLDTTIDSQNIANYGGLIFEKHIDYNVQFEDGNATKEDYKQELEFNATKEFEDNLIDIPLINYVVNIEDLRNTTSYVNYKQLEELQIGDVVHCRHVGLGIITDSRMIAYEFDSILKKYITQELGDFIPNFLQLQKKYINSKLK